ncbi:MAG: deoxyguanosinetriphosphate triphosphohydrolase [Clostridia bacterium]|nr:deoxyguanosinetriphosphate triphosphohydrolase [Clostridia bacterium]
MQSIKERTYAIEDAFLSPYACKSKNTLGRDREEEPCVMRTEFQRDRDRIIYCKAFRRLKNKTQVFFSPEGDHYITRLTHTLDVSQIAKSMARSLALNEDLAEAIALGHDLGHTPFGHSGERILDKLVPGGFKHNVQSVRVVEILEKDGKGLNLTKEVRDGILHHPKSGTPATLEGKCVSLADRVAYINHDLDDAIRAGLLTAEDVPKDIRDVLGNSPSARIDTAISSIYRNSVGKNFVEMESEVEKASERLREFMFNNVYYSPTAKGEEQKAERMLTETYLYFVKNPDKLPASYIKFLDKFSKEQVVCDYLSSMTDRYAVYTFNQIFVPRGWTFIDESN